MFLDPAQSCQSFEITLKQTGIILKQESSLHNTNSKYMECGSSNHYRKVQYNLWGVVAMSFQRQAVTVFISGPSDYLHHYYT